MPTKSTLKRLSLTPLILAASLNSLAADPKIDVRIDRGTSAYETEDYLTAMDNFTSALLYGIQANQNVLYPAAYLCGMWYNGRGIPQDTDRAIEACHFAAKGKSHMQLNIFQKVLEDNGAESSPTANKKASADAAKALRWYIDTQL